MTDKLEPEEGLSPGMTRRAKLLINLKAIESHISGVKIVDAKLRLEEDTQQLWITLEGGSIPELPLRFDDYPFAHLVMHRKDNGEIVVKEISISVGKSAYFSIPIE